MNTQPPVRAISVCIFDPSGKDTGKTFPEGSVWMLDRERNARRKAASAPPKPSRYSLQHKQTQMQRRAEQPSENRAVAY